MLPQRLQLGLLGFLSVVVICLLSVSAQQNEVKEAANWPWEKPYKFKCPEQFGTFSDPDDCSSFFVCVAKIATHRSCRKMTLFDKNLKKCVSWLIAVCDKSGKGTTTKTPKTEGTTPDGDKFVCPSISGSFVHSTDCTKYYTCTFFIPFLKTCPDNELFDGVKKQCRPGKEVHCGTRIRPTEPTISETTHEITTHDTTTEEAQPPTPTPTAEPPSPTTTTESPITTTTKKPRVTAPDTTCPEDDLDCIIDDLGENPVWFVCDEDMGSYPHPTSNKLFIFCKNWKPSVKKCGQDLIFSEDLMTCVSP
ncbi:hypothetical protein JTE90_016509 [Oedothorax gibbosus]|uniref:Chitin-binding type-2 domain-containing protein n=1 Tax=Oedothorax gibbosus TaxID=931172 RepID=A0AAV6U599_9ARAC|nr:hypothetical protein JTE90_016509 [Oedothorax gibbosus]